MPEGNSDHAADPRDEALGRAMARHQYSGDALIEILHAAQQLYGYLSPPLLRKIARRLMLPPSRVLGVATFYHLFRFSPPQHHSAVVCLGTACYASGATELMTVLRCRNAAAGWTIEAGRCVGSCGLAPIVICDGKPMSKVTRAQLEARIKEIHDSGETAPDPRR
jgi:bidirectional [NiFe] hydrogenase diaphorase subunit